VKVFAPFKTSGDSYSWPSANSCTSRLELSRSLAFLVAEIDYCAIHFVRPEIKNSEHF